MGPDEGGGWGSEGGFLCCGADVKSCIFMQTHTQPCTRVHARAHAFDLLQKGHTRFNRTRLQVKLIRDVRACVSRCVCVLLQAGSVRSSTKGTGGENKAVSRSLQGLFSRSTDSFINLLTNGLFSFPLMRQRGSWRSGENRCVPQGGFLGPPRVFCEAAL